MRLTRLDVDHFRILHDVSLSPHPALNLISGDNGSGKSSVLEAIQCLSTGYSFRTRKARELISRDQPGFMLTAQFKGASGAQDHRVGLARLRDGTVDLRLDYEPAKSLAEVTRLLPVKALTPDSHQLIQDGPDERRQFLDWALFHGQPNFFDTWRQYRRALLQRNQTLRDNAPDREVQSWDDQLAAAGELVSQYRLDYVTLLHVELTKRLQRIDFPFHVELKYRSGWLDDFTLSDCLQRNLDGHRRLKTTSDGPHRAELAILADRTPARQVLSRGEQKLLVYLLHLAQLDVLSAAGAGQTIVLCDDLTAELDEHRVQSVISELMALEAQIFVSGVDLSCLEDRPHNHFRVTAGQVEIVV